LNSIIYDRVSSSLVLARRLRSCYVMVFFDIDLLLSDLDRLVSDFDRLFLSDIDFLLSSFDWLVLPWTSENVLESWLVRAGIGFSFGFAARLPIACMAAGFCSFDSMSCALVLFRVIRSALSRMADCVRWICSIASSSGIAIPPVMRSSLRRRYLSSSTRSLGAAFGCCYAHHNQ